MLKSRLAKIVAAITSALIVLLEVPSVGKLLARAFAVVTGFDFFYERSKDPSWVGKASSMALNPPPGTALLVAIVGIALIYWTTKPREVGMSLPVLGMLVSVICLAGFSVWYLVKDQPPEPKQAAAVQETAVAPASDIDTHLSLKFGAGLPLANHLSNIWRWYALANVVVIVSPEGRKEIKTWNIFVTFEKPVNVSQVTVSSQSTLPEYEVSCTRFRRHQVRCFMEPEVCHGETEVHARVQA